MPNRVRKNVGTVRLDTLFEIHNGNGLVLTNMKRVKWPEGVNFVNRASGNNGVAARVQPPDDAHVWEGGLLSVALSGSVLSTFVQPDPFVTAFHVAVLVPLTPMSLPEKIWRASCIEANRYRYNYGRQANRTLGELRVPRVVPSWVEAVPQAAVAGLASSLRRVGDDFNSGDLADVEPFTRDTRVKIDGEPEDVLRALLKAPPKRRRGQ